MKLHASLRDAIDYLRLRKKAYCLAFGSPGTPAHEMLVDLARYCRAFEAPFDADPQRAAYLAGRRDAFFRIYQHIKLEPEELAELYRATTIKGQGDDR